MTTDPNLFPLRVEGERPPLFCVAAPGVNALGFTAIARLLPADLPVYVVQPKRRGRTFPADGIGPGGRNEHAVVAVEYLASIRKVQAQGPYTFAGMCDGAFIAFEMTRMLEADGERVTTLAVIDTWPLENTSIFTMLRLRNWWRGWSRRSWRERRDLVLRGGTRAPAPEAALRERLRARRMWPGRGVVLPVIEAHVAVLRVRGQPCWRIPDDALGWRDRTRGGVTVQMLPGDHDSCFRAPHVEHLARALSGHLAIEPKRGSSPAQPRLLVVAAWGRDVLRECVRGCRGTLEAP